ncbi:MAG: putative ATP-dependent ligase [Candidatus Kaiserbacteria bacterium]|nr:putative ATP-dependent ligase [Candidatus Kaiserbacteria bacterium]
MDLPLIPPIIVKTLTKPFDDPEWSFDLKYDGFRGVAYIQSADGKIISRENHRLSRFTPLEQKLPKVLGVTDAIFDGEVVVFDESKKSIFKEMLRTIYEPTYVAFDLLWLNGVDLRELPLLERRRRLHKLLAKKDEAIQEAFSVPGRGIALFDSVCKYDFEGIVAKKLSSPYRKKVEWFKIKNPEYSQMPNRSKIFNANRTRSKK